VKGKVNIYDYNGNIIYTIQGLINITYENGITIITYQEDNSHTRTIQTNMPYIYWQD
jgi:hypothetical protein